MTRKEEAVQGNKQNSYLKQKQKNKNTNVPLKTMRSKTTMLLNFKPVQRLKQEGKKGLVFCLIAATCSSKSCKSLIQLQ